MKTPKKIYLQTKDCYGDDNEVVTWCEDRINDIDPHYVLKEVSDQNANKEYLRGRSEMSAELGQRFTKEQVIELMERAWRASEIESNHSSRLPRTFCHWMDVVKPFGIK